MDKQGFIAWLSPLVKAGLLYLTKFIVPFLSGTFGVAEAAANNWWVSTASFAAGGLSYVIAGALERKHVLTKAANATDAKIAELNKP